MGKIKGEDFVNKPLRGKAESKPPSMRRLKRAIANGAKLDDKGRMITHKTMNMQQIKPHSVVNMKDGTIINYPNKTIWHDSAVKV